MAGTATPVTRRRADRLVEQRAMQFRTEDERADRFSKVIDDIDRAIEANRLSEERYTAMQSAVRG